MRLILTRHGETIENKMGIIQGHLPGKLSKLGKEQAKKLAKRLKNEKIDFIYSSDLARAADTAKEIAKFHPIIPVEFVEDLRERYLGSFQGTKTNEIHDDKIHLLESTERHEDIETNVELYQRINKFFNFVLNKHPNNNVLFVGHSGAGKALVCSIMNKSPNDIKTIENLSNTSVTIYEIDKDKNCKTFLFNCTKHLD